MINPVRNEVVAYHYSPEYLDTITTAIAEAGLVARAFNDPTTAMDHLGMDNKALIAPLEQFSTVEDGKELVIDHPTIGLFQLAELYGTPWVMLTSIPNRSTLKLIQNAPEGSAVMLLGEPPTGEAADYVDIAMHPAPATRKRLGTAVTAWLRHM